MNVYEVIENFYENYNGEKCPIGKSAHGRELYAFFAGEKGGVKHGILFLIAAGVGIAVCAVEWIASLVQGFV